MSREVLPGHWPVSSGYRTARDMTQGSCLARLPSSGKAGVPVDGGQGGAGVGPGHVGE